MRFLTAIFFLVVPFLVWASSGPGFSVVVYQDRAEVTQSVSLDLSEGAGSVKVDGLPDSLDADSIRFRFDDDDVVVTGFDLRLRRGSERVHQPTFFLENQLKEARRNLRVLDDLIEAHTLQLSLLQSVTQRDLSSEVDSGVLFELAADLGDRAAEVLGEIRDLDVEREYLSESIARLERELSDRGHSVSDTYTVVVFYDSDQAVSAQADITYVVSAAGWEPFYDWRLDTETGALTLQKRAQVRQGTGHDWVDARIELALGQPAAGGRMPVLQSWFLDTEKPQVAGRRAQGAVFSQAAPDGVFMEMEAPAPAELTGTEMAARYALPNRLTVSGDNSPQRLLVRDFLLEADVSVRVVPRLAQRAWLHAEAEFNEDVWLPAGRVTLYQDGQVVGRVRSESLAPGDALSAPFGVADRVTVDFQVIADRRGSAGVVRRQNTLQRSFVVSITNGYGRALPVSVLDRMPVARDERIEIGFVDGSRLPDDRDVDDRPGIVRWNLDVDSGEEVRVEYGYRVVFPRDVERVIGW